MRFYKKTDNIFEIRKTTGGACIRLVSTIFITVVFKFSENFENKSGLKNRFPG